MIGTCSLCQKDVELLKKSHIIPDFIYRKSDMYDEKHRFNTFTKEDLLNNRKIKQVQSGTYEGGILCAKCDNEIIGGYEKYAYSAIYGGELYIEECPVCVTFGNESPEVTICKNLDYKKYKLFLLSILFRSAITSDDFFSEVMLSEEDLNSLRKMIYEGNPQNLNDFPIVVGTFATSNLPDDIILNPKRLTQDGQTTFSFMFGGMVYMFYVGTNLSLADVGNVTIQPNSILPIFHFNGDNGNNFFKRLIGVS